MDWKCCEFTQLTSVEIYLILRARNAILVVDDAHMHQDIDGKDENAVHVFALDTVQGESLVVAYARLRPGDEVDPEATIEKQLTHTTHRDDDTVDRLIEHVLSAASERWPHAPLRTHSPVHRESFYKRFGFSKVDGPFLQHGMPFIGMIRPADPGAISARSQPQTDPTASDAGAQALAQVTGTEQTERRAESTRNRLSPRLHTSSGVRQ
ncbi:MULTISPECIES: GNAT family N-acetyltransferase [Paraburkholderia]|uniref:GNAT family N-acetyltransferase n=2 Tax=Paraburkholderia TaxID=1822464 RepID=A0ABW9D2A9_9BURK|nr:GNAT family N-acetyltransferase [Paraburkholderia bryophila]NYH14484.1 putative GNAT family N-acyltransferase [Paraburkholderia bryophila]NYH27180.1 putative GNAT family N-acyltransferase [Paraburkholderia bryophila]